MWTAASSTSRGDSSVQQPMALYHAGRLLAEDVEKGRLSQSDASQVQQRIRFTDQLSAMSDASFVIEAIKEDRAAKKELFVRLSQIVGEECVVSSNTSSI